MVDINEIKGEEVEEGDIDRDFVTSLMIENGRYATIEGLDGLARYNFWELPKTRTRFEQK